MKYDSKNISIKYVIIGIVFATMFALLYGKMEVKAETIYKTDISPTEEVNMQTAKVRFEKINDAWCFTDSTGTTYSLTATSGYSTDFSGDVYMITRKALYENGVLTKYTYDCFFTPLETSSLNIELSGTTFKMYGMSAMYTTSVKHFYVEFDAEEVYIRSYFDKYHTNQNSLYVVNYSYVNSEMQPVVYKDLKTYTTQHGTEVYNTANGEYFFRVTPQGTIATVIRNNQIQLNPLQEIMKVLPMVILFLVGYLGLWKALEIFRRLLHKA